VDCHGWVGGVSVPATIASCSPADLTWLPLPNAGRYRHTQRQHGPRWKNYATGAIRHGLPLGASN